MTVAPPLSRSHLVPALTVTAVLCVAFACPTVASPPEGKGPAAQTHGVGHGAGKPKRGLARGHAKQAARVSSPGQSAAARGQAPRVLKSPSGRARGNPHTAAPTSAGTDAAATSASEATTPAVAPSGRKASSASVKARAARATRARRAAQRASAAAAAAAGAARDRAFSGGEAEPAGKRTKARTQRERHAFIPVQTQDELPQPLSVARDIVEVVPTTLRVLFAGLAALSVLLAITSGLTLLRNRRLAGQRRDLLGQVGLLQAALLPDLPESLSSCRASVAYRPADGPGAGGDFYDVLPLAGGKTAVLIGDVSGHGRAALGRTALARYTLRAYVEAGLEPREALQIAGSVLAGKLQGDFVTALLAIHDAADGTLTYSTAGHPPPIVISPAEFEPVLVATAPPLGVGASTGQRQTTLPFPPGAVACFYTDGLTESRTAGGQLGTSGLERIVRELGPEITARQVINRVAASARRFEDDAAACVLTAEGGAAIVRSRVERLEISRAELRGPMLRGFLDACGVSVHGVRAAERQAREVAGRMGGALVEVTMGDRSQVDVLAPDLPLRDDVTASLHQA